MEDLEYKIAEREQKDLDYNINVNGLPNMSYEDSVSTFINIGKELQVDISKNDIASIQQLENKRTKKLYYSFQLKDSQIKSLFIQKRKQKKIFITASNQITSSEENLATATRLYINEHLSKFNFDLLNHAKSLKQHGYNYICYKFGKIFVRKSGNSNIILIRSMNMVNDLINNLPNA